MDYRIGIDVMTTETACLTSIWETDGAVRDYLALHGRAGDYAPLHPEDGAYYDGLIELDLSAIEAHGRPALPPLRGGDAAGADRRPRRHPA